MVTFRDLEDNLKTYIIEEQSDAHNIKSTNFAKYNNIKISINAKKITVPHFIVRISISEAAFSIESGEKINGGLGYEEKFISKWFGRSGTKEKLLDLWKNRDESD